MFQVVKQVRLQPYTPTIYSRDSNKGTQKIRSLEKLWDYGKRVRKNIFSSTEKLYQQRNRQYGNDRREAAQRSPIVDE